MICENCRTVVTDLPFCPHCGYRLNDKVEYPAQEQNPHGKPDVRARRRRILRRWILPLVLLFVIIAFGVLGLALMGFRDGVRDHNQATLHETNIHYNRGLVYLETEWYQMAEAEFDEALRLAPDHVQAAEKRRIAQTRQTVMPSPTASPTPLPTATVIPPTPTPQVVVIPVTKILFEEGQAHYDSQEWEQAIAKLEQLRAEDATFRSDQVADMLFHSYYHYGIALDEQDMVEEAITQYDRALDLIPRHPEVEERRRQADLYQSAMGFWNLDWERAILNLTSLYARAPDYKDAADRLYQACLTHAQNMIKRERYCAAAELYEQALEIKGEDDEIADWEFKTRDLCQTTTPPPLDAPTVNGPWYKQGVVHIGTLVGTCYNPRTDQYDICAQNAEENVLSTWITPRSRSMAVCWLFALPTQNSPAYMRWTSSAVLS
jgi:tetratricopeptide (TPR) repeat protein